MSLIKNEPKTLRLEAEANESGRFFLFRWISQGKVKALVLLAYLAVVAIFISVFASFYIPGKRFSYVVMFGGKQPPVLSELDKVDYYSHENSLGYDGQFYAQIAVDPTLRNSELRHSLDSPDYRARRILVSLSAYLMGWGIPEAVLHTYTLQNPIVWLALAVLMFWWFPPNSWGNWFRWTGVLLCSGMWASVINALTDGPSLLLVAFGVFLIEKNRPWLAAVVFGMSGLAKETNILSGAVFIGPKTLITTREWPKLILKAALLLAPLVLWLFYVKKVFGLDSSSGTNNFSWPLVTWAWKAKENAIDAFSQGLFDKGGLPNFSFLCLLGLIALTVQFAFFVFRPQWDKVWWRVGVSSSFLMSILGQSVWEGYSGASFRVLLPMQLAFNVLVPRTRRWLPILILGNLSLFTEIPVIRDRTKHARSIARVEQVLQTQRQTNGLSKKRSIEVDFSSGWYGIERSATSEWTWSSGPSEVILHNNSRCPEAVSLAFLVHSLEERDLKLIGADGKVLWHTDSLKEKTRVTVADVVLEPGNTVFRFETTQEPSFALPDTRPLAFCVENFSISEARNTSASVLD